jgi:hypothetical protein
VRRKFAAALRQQFGSRAWRLTAITVVALPINLIAGLLGMTKTAAILESTQPRTCAERFHQQIAHGFQRTAFGHMRTSGRNVTIK